MPDFFSEYKKNVISKNAEDIQKIYQEALIGKMLDLHLEQPAEEKRESNGIIENKSLPKSDANVNAVPQHLIVKGKRVNSEKYDGSNGSGENSKNIVKRTSSHNDLLKGTEKRDAGFTSLNNTMESPKKRFRDENTPTIKF